MTGGGLDGMRDEVRRIDDEILRLARKRTKVAARIGRWKQRHALPVRDYETEQEVLAATAERCGRLGLDPEVGRQITRALISGAVRAQEQLFETRHEGSLRRISILGGKGRMGSWLAHYMHSRGHRVTIHDPAGRLRGFRNAGTLERAVSSAEIILLSVPLRTAPQVYREIRRLRPRGTIIDLLSLKTPALPEIRNALAEGLSVSSIHPLFGPDVFLLSDRILLICPCGDEEADRVAGDLFQGTSLEVVTVPVEQHDRAMGIVLGLSHAVNIIFSEALARSGMSGEEVRRVATTTYLKQSGTSSEVARENPRLYHEIQNLNQYTPEVFALFQQAFETFKQAATRRNPSSFIAMMRRGRRFFDV
ncbi:MAG: bifunctional chorismate mutase/prephenate dehydrogenase [Planctomycetota bacterium]